MINLKKRNQKGFTLIELLVVIAIIAILAGILLVAINPKEQTDKADDVRKKSNLSQLKTLGVLYLDNNDSYLNFCDSSKTSALVTDTDTAVCYDESSAWAAEAQLSGVTTDDYYCIDSTGYAGDPASTLGVGDTACHQ